MNTGKVKFYNEEKGFGFIIPNNPDDQEIFFHISDVYNNEILQQNDTVSYTIGDWKKGPKAENVTFVQ